MKLTKICSKCREEKSLSEFNKQAKNKDGLRSDCRLCSRKRNLIYYYDNQERMQGKSREWKKNNADKNIKYMTDYRIFNKEKIRIQIKNNIDNLRDPYLKTIVRQSFGAVNKEHLPKIIEAKRLMLQIHREINKSIK